MGDAHRGVRRVHRLPARPRAAIDVDLQLGGVDADLHLVRLGKDGDGGGRSVDPPLRLGLWHALHAVGAGLVLEDRVGAVALDRKGIGPVPDRQRLDLEATPLRVPGQHPVQIAGPQGSLIAARAGPDLDDHVLVVVRIALDHRQADFLLERLQPLPRRFEHVPHLGVVAVLGQKLASSLEIVGYAAVLGREPGGRFEFPVGLARRRVALAVADHFRVGKLSLELGEAFLHL